MINKLSRTDLEQQLSRLNQTLSEPWQLKNEKLHKAFCFTDFASAFAFMQRVAIEAEKQQHHPDWSNRYNNVWISLTTHEVDGISRRDFELAKSIEELLVTADQK